LEQFLATYKRKLKTTPVFVKRSLPYKILSLLCFVSPYKIHSYQ